MAGRLPNRARGRTAKSNSRANGVIANLRNREQVEQPDITPDITKVEKDPTLNKTQNSTLHSGLDSESRKDKQKSKKSTQSTKNPAVKAVKFVGNHKKGSIATVIVLLVVAAFFIGSIVVSGPMQFMQFTGLVKNSIQFMSDSVSSTRIMRNVVDIAQGPSYNSGSISNKRMEKMGRMMTDAYLDSLTDKGIYFDPNSKTVTIDLDQRYSQNGFNAEKIKKKINQDLGISIDILKYNSSDSTITFETTGGSWIDKQSTNFLLALEREIGNPSIEQVSAVRRNKMVIRLGLYSWLHPISHADQVELRKTMGHLEAWYASRLAKMSGQEISGGKLTNDLAKKLKDILDEKMIKRTTNIDLSSVSSDEQSQWMLLALAMACVNYDISRPTQWYPEVVMPAIMEALAVRSIEGQIHSVALNTLSAGLQDFSFEDLAGPTQDYFYDNSVTLAGPDGVSGWSGAPVKAALGYQVNDLDKTQTVDYAFRFKEFYPEVNINQAVVPAEQNPEQIVGSQLFDLHNDLLANNELPDSVTDFIKQSVDGEAAKVLGWIKNTAFGNNIEQTYWSKMLMGIKNYSLQVFSMNPAQKLTTAMYGSKFLEDFDNITLGGRRLSETELAILYGDNQQKLASNYQDKPLVDKLFDPTDYRSAVSTLARSSGWDTSGSSALSHLANIVKTFSQVPTLLADRVGGMFHGAVGAATTNTTYDYGTDWYGYSKDEQANLRDVGGRSVAGSQLSVLNNTERVYSLISNNHDQVNRTAVECFATVVAQDGTLARVNNVYADGQDLLSEDGSFNIYYAAGMAFNYTDCRDFGLSTEDLLALRTYILDYNLMSAGTCYLASVSPDKEFDSDGDGVNDMTYLGLGGYTCGDFAAGVKL